MDNVVAFAPGRVNLLGDHTDYTGGLCLPMALTLGVTIRGSRGGDVVELTSDRADGAAVVPIDIDDPAQVTPPWARFVAGVVAEAGPTRGFRGVVTSDLPIGAGLSSSAALEVAVAMALGIEGDSHAVAALCQRAEQRASGVPCGILDQLSSTRGVEGHALLMDCSLLTTEPIRLPDDLEVVVVHSGQERTLAGSAYAERRAECEAAEAEIGPLRSASLDDVRTITDRTLRRRARHVVSENARVRSATAALADHDLRGLGLLFSASHDSLRDDFECSTPTVDDTVARLVATPGVHGARMTGGGWGGCVVAVTEPGALEEGWRVRPGGPARVDAQDAPDLREPDL
ncbi:galactokinase [Actinospongicola halichondriae]|uniref:galactokinase n=1 Tax=Actinospongicola halichondriae TaxID=3236844 RepID=UPI003D5C6EF7